VRAAGAYSGICSEIYVWMERSRAASILLPPIYNFSAHLRQLSDARERTPALQPGDSILRRVVYHRRDRKNCRLRVEHHDLLPRRSRAIAIIEGQGATRNDAIFKSTGYKRNICRIEKWRVVKEYEINEG